MSSSKKITLKSSDGELFEVDEAVALESQTIKHVIEDDCPNNGIPLPNVTSKILAKVIEYCKKHVETPKPDANHELKTWDAEFVKVDQATLLDLIWAADYLNINGLLDLTCQTVADMIKGKTPEDVEEIRRENQWLFEIVTMLSVKKITLKSSDSETFKVDEAVALESQIIKYMIEDDCTDNGIPLPNVTSKILAKVIEYCKKHVETPKPDTNHELETWDAEFVKVDQATLFDLIQAANYLNIKGLLDLTCQTVADMIKGKTPEEIRMTFNINNVFTPEEEEEVRRENQWAFE
ncbi:SKP1-like protein 1A isoform X2 [Manihot esculenta]|uniref:Uncharacterized protein n=1 Tax=Manihot esculenta TaxID=3983 RepID=A0ACB7I755_MANES|nr:SKP1-like protein 1A isoform X2 [Manihot esculenta]KAG8660039.1 hypothetical protein MANES_02G108501v8 [Manihot esculenta]